MKVYVQIKQELKKMPKVWLITGVAGFIGSNLLETLLNLNQKVVGLDNFSTGCQHNLDEVQQIVSKKAWNHFKFIEGDIRNVTTCRKVCNGVDYVLHQAALGSIPRSIENPININENNITGFLNMLVAARDTKVQRFVYAASSSIYGDHPGLLKVENKIGKPLSPYAVTKYVNELYADIFARTYGFKTIGLRYFNVFGKRQEANGAYAAVIPKWFGEFIKNSDVAIYGDGETSRDFCYIEDCVKANILAGCVSDEEALNQVYNVAVGESTTLNQLYKMIKKLVSDTFPHAEKMSPFYKDFRAGDVRHSLADIGKAKLCIGYFPEYTVYAGLKEVAKWYFEKLIE